MSERKEGQQTFCRIHRIWDWCGESIPEMEIEIVQTGPQVIEVSEAFFAKLEKAKAKLDRKKKREERLTK